MCVFFFLLMNDFLPSTKRLDPTKLSYNYCKALLHNIIHHWFLWRVHLFLSSRFHYMVCTHCTTIVRVNITVLRFAHTLHGTKMVMVGNLPFEYYCLKRYSFEEMNAVKFVFISRDQNSILKTVKTNYQLFSFDSDGRLCLKFPQGCYFMYYNGLNFCTGPQAPG